MIKSTKAEKSGILSGFGRNKADKDLIKEWNLKRNEEGKKIPQNNQDESEGRSQLDNRPKTEYNMRILMQIHKQK